ncbi:lytic transglycosylase [Streptomyces malachitofuscus]|nr:lytic transglycosylase [Streptomyces malachitofuscus]
MAAHFGRRLRKGAATTAVAAAAVAALSASQAPGVTADGQGRQTTADTTPSPEEAADSATGNSPYYTDLPPLNSPNPSPSAGTGPGDRTASEAGIPATVLDAYKKAEAALREKKPGCNLPWQLLAAIGKVESGQARGGRVSADGTTLSPILGPQLDGNGFALIKDTDNGAYDGNSTYDQAVGPMQFIPSTWAWAGRDGNGDGREDPNNIYDAALSAGHYLCRNGWDLSDRGDLRKAILSYNNSTDYLNTVLRWLEYYRKGTHEIPDGTGSLPVDRSDDGTVRPSPSSSATPPAPKPGTKPGNKPGTEPGGSRPSPGPGTPGTGSPTTPPPTTPPPTTTPPTPTDTVDHLEDAGTGALTAMAGDAFTKRISTRAETDAGKAVAKVRIRFTILGDTGTTFAGGENVATVVTGSSGVAVAPALQAGETPGSFTVRAVVVGRAVPGVGYQAKVTERAADTLVRTGDAALTCTPGGTFATAVEVRATYGGAAADKVAATATLITSADNPAENDKGPYFKDADGKAVRTLSGLKTDADGLLKLPQLYADDTTGTFLLRVTTAGGAALTVELTVAAAETPSPSPSTSSPTA